MVGRRGRAAVQRWSAPVHAHLYVCPRAKGEFMRVAVRLPTFGRRGALWQGLRQKDGPEAHPVSAERHAAHVQTNPRHGVRRAL